jgi:hypothetical protein
MVNQKYFVAITIAWSQTSSESRIELVSQTRLLQAAQEA